MSDVKRCIRCGEAKPLDAFHYHRGRPRGDCKECRNASERQRYVANPEVRERRLERQRASAAAGRDKTKERLKRWRTEHPDRMQAIRERYAETQKQRQRARHRQRKAWALALLGGKCVKCGTAENLEFDHIDPLTKSFTIAMRLSKGEEKLRAELAKCQLLCQPCHLEKTRVDLSAYHARRRQEVSA